MGNGEWHCWALMGTGGWHCWELISRSATRGGVTTHGAPGQ
ncbi:unnamed protein product [Staurois parvus]|uniref:Uncharacterized protein n=1 Tax=Staurois parvus TaxID=386267 RepID=A0ABN9BG50_9NEOB|nr:unnamed protein product [Staurois parvus]